MNKVLIKNLKNISKKDVLIAGGKGASLGEMKKISIPIPPGFIIESKNFDQFLKNTNLDTKIHNILLKVNIKENKNIEKTSNIIRKLILKEKMPEHLKVEIIKNFKNLNSKFVAVRSSATAEDSSKNAWAGQLETYINTTEETLLENIKKCWASLFTPRAIFYRLEQKLEKSKISVAVIVQKMVNAEKSGVGFSVNPVTEDRSQIIIEACFGLGEAIVSGQITPNNYIIEKKSLKTTNINLSEQKRGLFRKKRRNLWKDLGKKSKKQVLNKDEILELSKLIIKIENHYRFPVDIEWAKEKNRFYILQSRPITTLKKRKKQEDLLNKIDRENFHKSLGYTFAPLIYFEKSIESYLKNPLIKKLKAPKFIILSDLSYRRYIPENLEKINDNKDIIYVIKDCKKLMRLKKKALTLLNQDYNFLKDEEIIKIIKENEILYKELYSRVILFMDELFETKKKSLLKQLPKTRLHLSKFIDLLDQISHKVIDEIYERVKHKKISWKNLLYLSSKELITILKNPEKFHNLKLINKQKKVFFFDGQKIFKFENQKIFKKILSTLNKANAVKEIKGNVAFNGNAKGEVIKITEKDYNKYDKILQGKKGYILVTQMTRPEIVPYLKKAKGIITDEGGITCHAAIIAREMKIPCIVGTKIATKVLKNKEIIEIDANRGIVKKV